METFAEYYARVQREQQQQKAKQSATLAVTMPDSPDEVAGASRLAEEYAKITGKPQPPVEIVRGNASVFQREIDQRRATTILSSAPRLADWMADPNNAVVAKDDLEGLSWWETKVLNSPGALTRAAGRGTERVGMTPNVLAGRMNAEVANDIGKTYDQIYAEEAAKFGETPPAALLGDIRRKAQMRFDMVDGLTAEDKLRFEDEAISQFKVVTDTLDRIQSVPMSEGATRFRDEVLLPAENSLTGVLGAFASDPTGGLSFLLEVAAESLPQLAASGVATAVGGPMAGVATMGAGSFLVESQTETAEFLREKGLDLTTRESALEVLGNPEILQEASDRGLARGLIVGVLDAVSGGIAGQQLAKSALGNFFLQAVAQSTLGGAGEAGAQLATEGELNWADVVTEALAEFATTPIEIAAMGGGKLLDLRRRQVEAREAEDRQNFFRELSGQAVNSKLRERMPEAFRRYLDRALADGPVENVYIPADKFNEYFQSRGIDPLELVGEIDGVTREDIEAAIATGGDIKIPTATYAAKIAGSEHDAFLMQNMRTAPDQMTAVEAQEFEATKNERMAEVMAEVDREAMQATEAQTYADQIMETVSARLVEAGTAPDVASAQSVLWRDFYVTQAARAGITMQEMLQQYPLPAVRGDIPQPLQPRENADLARILADARAGMNPQQTEQIERYLAEIGSSLDLDDAQIEADIRAANEADRVMYGQDGRMRTETPEFKAWFGASKVVDESGEPMTVYHGTALDGFVDTTNIEAFDPGRTGDRWGADRRGFFFTNDPRVSNYYATSERDGAFGGAGPGSANGAVYPVYLSIQNPLIVDVPRTDDVVSYWDNNQEDLQRRADDAGNDGVILRDLSQDVDGGPAITAVAFSPTQIKSVFNRGTFDPNDPRILFQTATIRRGEETLERFGLDPNGRYTTREVAAALEARQRKRYGLIERNDFSEKAERRIAQWMVDEVLFEVEQAEENPMRSAVGWYSTKFQSALDALGEAFPEFTGQVDTSLPGVARLGNQKNARDFFTALMAITSDGAKVADNFRFASQAYEQFRQTGVVNSDVTFGGERNKSMRVNLANIQKVLDERGADGMASFLLTKDTISNLKKVAKAEGVEFSSAYKASMELPYAAVVFGPKLGAFYANLMGDTGYLTMDRWWSRTFNRYRGSLLAQPTSEGVARVRELIAADRGIDPETMTDDEVLLGTVDYVRSYKAKGYKDGTEIERAANTVYKAAFEQLNDTPLNASDREFMINTTVRAQKMLKRRGVDMTVADLQAVLWYYEKRLYGQLGARQTQDISYEEIARDVAAGRDPAERPDDAGTGEPGDEIALDVASTAGTPTDGPATDAVDPEYRAGRQYAQAGAGGYASGSLAPLAGAPRVEGASGPDARLVAVAEQYARANGIELRRQAEFVEVDPERAARIAAAYEAMPHAPQDPAVKEAYQNLIQQTVAQYRALVEAGYVFYFFDDTNDPYGGNPWNAMRDLRANQRMAVYATEAGFGSGATELNVDDNPMLADTGIEWGYGSPDGEKKRVLANDLFRAVHDAFGHGIEGAGFRARGEENAWQAHVRLFTGSAVAAITTETRGQNSWLNYGPYGEQNRTAAVEDTVFADQKTGLMPAWTWEEGRAGDEQPVDLSAPVGAADLDRIDENFLRRPGYVIFSATRGVNGPWDSEQNVAAAQEARDWMARTGTPFVEIMGRYEGVDDGPSFIAIADEREAKMIARKFGQDSVLTNKGLIGGTSEFSPVPSTGEVRFGTPAELEGDYFSILPDGRAFTVGLNFDYKMDLARIPAGFTQRPDRPQLPIRPDGMVELVHWSNRKRSKIDPSKAGTGPLEGPERRRDAKLSFFGINPRQSTSEEGTGYVKEMGLGPWRHTVAVDPDELYPWFEDPDGLKSRLEPGEQNNVDAYENLIREAGYIGYYTTEDGQGSAPLGNAAALFEPVAVESVVDERAGARGYGQSGVDLTETPEFKAWFGESVVKEGTGKPKVVYHGSEKAGFTVFDTYGKGKTRGTGAFFTDEQQNAMTYSGTYNAVQFPTKDEVLKSPQDYGFDVYEWDDAVWVSDPDGNEARVEDAEDKYDDEKVAVVLAPMIDDWLTSGRIGEDRGNYEVYLKIENPYIYDAKGKSWDALGGGTMYNVVDEDGDVVEEFYDKESAEEFLAESPDEGYSIDELEIGGDQTTDEIVRDVKEWGDYDGVIFENISDEGPHGRGYGIESTVYVVFDPAQIKSVQNRGTFDPKNRSILYQNQRGSIQIPAAGIQSGQVVINLMRQSDLSTFLHESGHFFLLVKQDMAEKGMTSAATEMGIVRSWWRSNAADVAKDAMRAMPDVPVTTADVEAYLDNGTTGDIRKDAAIDIGTQEQWARGLEAYLMEGRAPSAELRSVFAKFRAWLISIYRSATGLNVEISPEIRAIFDRMFATDQQIMGAKQQTGDRGPLFKSAQEMGLSPEDYERYREIVMRAEDEANARLQAEIMDPIRRAEEKKYREEREGVRAEVETRVNARREYRAIEWMGNRRWLGEDRPTSLPDIRIDKQALIDRYGPDILKQLPRGQFTIYTVEGGASPDDVAGLFGFRSGDEMIQAIGQAQPRKAVIEAETDAVMFERYGDPLKDGTVTDKALEALHSGDTKARALAIELDVLNARPGGTRSAVQVFRQMARETLARMKVRDAAQPNRFLAAERRAADQSYRLFAAGDLQGAAEAKRRQLLNHLMYTEARKISDEVDAAQELARKLQKKSVREKLAGDYLDAIDEVLQRHDFRQISNRDADRRGALLAYVQRMTDEGRENELAIPERVLQDGQRTPFRQLTVEHLRGVVDTLKNIEHTARLKKKLQDAQSQRDLDEVVESIVAEFDANLPKRPPGRVGTTGEAVRTGVRQFFDLVLNATTLLREIDGFKDFGPAYRNIKSPIDAAMNRLQERRQKAAEDLDALYEVYTKQERRRMADRQHIPEIGMALSKWERIGVALNMGNEGNYQRLTDTRVRGGFTEDQVRAIVAGLDARDAQFVQSVWDYLDTFRADIEAREKRTTGVAPKWVEARPVEIAGVTLRGGYYPLKYDARLSSLARDDQMAELNRALQGGRFGKAQTKNGHLKERAASSGRTVDIDISVLHRHVQQVVYDLELSEPVANAWKILQDSRIRGAFTDAGKQADFDALETWVLDVGTGEIRASDPVSRNARRFKSNFTAAKLAFNLSTVAVQITGVAQSMVVVGKADFLSGVVASMRPGAREEMYAKSIFMRDRSTTFNKDIFDLYNDPKTGPVMSRWSELRNEWIAPAGLWLMTKVQMFLVDAPTWMAGYQQGLRKFNNDEAQAIAYADDIVKRAQASGLFSDRSAVERGSVNRQQPQSDFIRLFTALGSYMFQKFNVAYERTQTARRVIGDEGVSMRSAQEALSWAIDVGFLFTLEAVLYAAIKGRLPDEEDDEEGDGTADEWASFLAGQTGLALMSTIPFVRDLGGAISGFSGGGAYGSIVEEMTRPLEQTMQGEVDRAWLKSVINATGLFTGLPSSAINRMVDAGWRQAEGEDVSPAEYLLGRMGP